MIDRAHFGCIPLLVLAISVSAPSLARADPRSSVEAADELFERAKELLQAGNWPDACAKFQASMALDPAVGTRLKLAKCDEHDGKLVRALAGYRAALKLNHEKTNQTEARRAELEEFTERAIAELQPRVPKLRIVLTERPPGLRVTLAGEELPLAALGQELPVDPGPLELAAEAPGHEAVRRPLMLREASTTELVVALLPSAPPPPPPPPPPASSGSVRRTVGFVVGGAGVVGLGVAGWLGLRTSSKVNESTSSGDCSASYRCNRAGANLLADARTAQTGAFTSLALGALALGCGVYLIASQSPAKARPSTPSSSATPTALGLGVLPAGAFVGGAF